MPENDGNRSPGGPDWAILQSLAATRWTLAARPRPSASGGQAVRGGGRVTRLEIVGRASELAAIDAFLDAVPTEPGFLDLVGDPGIGKTVLLEELADRASARGLLVRIARPSPAEASFSYATLGDLVGDLVPAGGSVHAALPEPQRWALDVALLREPAGDRTLEAAAVAAAVRTALVGLAGEQPIVLVVDDGQWLDRASEDVLRYTFRRVAGQPIGLATGRRKVGSDDRPTAPLLDPGTTGIGATTLSIDRLSGAALYRIVQDRFGLNLARRDLDRIDRLSAGNPFYAIELARAFRDTPPGAPLRLPAGAVDALREVLARLPERTRRALLRAAAHRAPTGAEVALDDLDPAELAGIVRIDATGRVAFTHPTWTLTVYESATAADRRAVHRELAGLATEPEEQARHGALGSDGPDAGTAEILDLAADRAEARGAAEAAAQLAELAVGLTPGDDVDAGLRRSLRLGRLLAIDNLPRSRTVLDSVAAGAPPGRIRAEALLELAIVVWNLGEVRLGVRLGNEALGAWDDPRFHGLVHARLSWMVAERVDHAADEARLALETLDEGADRELVGFALLYRAQWDLLAGRGADEAALARGRALTESGERSWLTPTVGATWAKMLDDFETARERYRGYVREGEAAGDDISMVSNLAYLADIAIRTGQPGEAERLIDEAVTIGAGTGSSTWEAVALAPAALVDAFRGRHAEAAARAHRILELIGDSDEPLIEAHARAILGFLALTDGDPVTADRELSRADAALEKMGMIEPAPYRFHADHVEAVVAIGDLERAEGLVRRLEARRAILPKPWTVVMAARARGLVAAARGDLEAAEASCRAALAGYPALAMPFERGRDLVLLGVLLRRRRRRAEAADLFDEAAAVFDAIGSPRWADRARDELARLGTQAGEAGQLTPSEERIARLAGSGLTNREVADRLRISPKTVEANLAKAYAKLAIRTRAELGRWAVDGPSTPSEAGAPTA